MAEKPKFRYNFHFVLDDYNVCLDNILLCLKIVYAYIEKQWGH